MLPKYRIYQIQPEQIILGKEIGDGMLRKDWYNHPELGECLFKEARPSRAIITESRADWSEKVVNEIANLLNLPVARYELATGYFEESAKLIDGVVSINCIPGNALVFTGEEFLSESIDYNPGDPSRYTIENVLHALEAVNVKPPSNWQQPILEINTGAELFVGYMMLDALVNNSDRHDHNWGVMAVNDSLELISSFDHGLSLGSTDEDDGKPNLLLSDYVERISTSSFQEGYNRLSTLTVFDRAAQLYPDSAMIWQEKLATISPAQINDIFNRIPDERITPTAAKFAIDLLEFNQQRLMSMSRSIAKSFDRSEVQEVQRIEGISTSEKTYQPSRGELLRWYGSADLAQDAKAKKIAVDLLQQLKCEFQATGQGQTPPRDYTSSSVVVPQDVREQMERIVKEQEVKVIPQVERERDRSEDYDIEHDR